MLTTQEKIFVDKLVKTGLVYDSATLAGYKQGSYGSFLKRQPKIQRAIVARLEKEGVTDTAIVRKLKQGLAAYYPPRKDGGKKYPDFFTRGLYLDKLHKIRGDYSPERIEIEERREFHIIFTPDTLKGLMDSGIIEAQELEATEEGGEIIYKVKEKEEL